MRAHIQAVQLHYSSISLMSPEDDGWEKRLITDESENQRRQSNIRRNTCAVTEGTWLLTLIIKFLTKYHFVHKRDTSQVGQAQGEDLLYENNMAQENFVCQVENRSERE